MKKLVAVLAVALLASLAFRAPLRAQDEKDGDEKSEKKTDKAEKKEKPALTAVGGLAASTAYFSFALVGVTADSFEKKQYDAARTKALAGEVMSILKTNGEQLDALKKSGELDEADSKAVGDFVTLMAEVRDYAKKLEDYTEDKTKENAEAFQKARQKGWKHLKEVLGIKER